MPRYGNVTSNVAELPECVIRYAGREVRGDQRGERRRPARRKDDVTVVDARSRVGGRVCTVREGFADGQHAEAGGDLIDEGQHEIRTLAEELGLKLSRVLPGGFGYALPDGAGKTRIVARSAARGWDRLATTLEGVIRPYQLAEQRWDSPIAADLSRRSVAQWLDEIKADQELRSTILGLRGFFLADPEELSLLALVDQFASGDQPGWKTYRIDGGNDRLATSIGALLGDRLKLKTEVVAVSHRGREVRISLKNGRDVSHLTRNYVLFALPATLLRRTPITPALPAQQHEAIGRLKYGRATKTLLQFSKRFWRAPGRRRAFGSSRPFGAVWEANEEQRGRAGILSLMAGGSASDMTQAMTTKDGTAGLVDSLDWLGAKERAVGGVAPDGLGGRSLGARRLRVLRSLVRSRAPCLARPSLRPAVLRRRAHQRPLAGIHERRDRNRPPRGGGNRRRAPDGELGEMRNAIRN